MEFYFSLEIEVTPEDKMTYLNLRKNIYSISTCEIRTKF